MHNLTETLLHEQEEKILGEHLSRAQRAEALRALTGGIAHDFNNILTGVLGNLQLAEMDLPAGHASQDSLQASIQACRNACVLVARIMAFSRLAHADQAPASREPVKLDKVA